MKKLISILSIIVLALAGCSSTEEKSIEDLDTLKIQIAPTNDPQQAQEAATLWTESLTEEFHNQGYEDLSVEVGVGTDPVAIGEAVHTGSIDVGFIPASDYVMANEKHPDTVQVFMQATREERDDEGNTIDGSTASAYDATLYVNKDTYEKEGMEDWSDEDVVKWLTNGDTNIGVSSYTSSSSYVWPINFMLENGTNPNDAKITKVASKSEGIQMVYDGNLDATFAYLGAAQDLEKQDPEKYSDATEQVVVGVKNVGKVRVPNDVAVINGEFDQESRDAIVSVFEALSETEEGREVLEAAYSWVGVVPTNEDDEDWEVIKEYHKNYEPYKK